MGSRLPIVFSFLFACVRLSDARLLSMSVPTRRGVEQQKPAVLEVEPAAEPEREHSSQSARQTDSLQSKQTPPAASPFSWKFPEDPVDPVNESPAEFKLPQPVVTNRVAVRCGESKIQVEVNQDLQGLGRLIDPEDITLGGCSATEIDDLSHVLIFESELHGCGSVPVMTEIALIYAFTLVYNPKVLGGSPIIRRQSAVIGVECHYLRKQSLSHLHLAWKHNKDAVEAEQQPRFSLQLMDDDWLSERTSSKYALGDTINMQASVMRSNHTPLRVLAKSCVATKWPDSTSEPRHAFIKNNGWVLDIHTGSRFRPQTRPEKLQFQMYITCKLKAIPASSPVTIQHKACSFDVGWREATGKHQFCSCCEDARAMRKIRDVDAAIKGNGMLAAMYIIIFHLMPNDCFCFFR
uniref:Zona pellucida sperm-binding protein 3 n=1 Tax=Acanthochromis polyacanthus TaxID=80966 RepID=A0A3Q1G335_9TELE